MTEYGILVGFDGSAGSFSALRWAVREARDRGTQLTIILASDIAPPGQPPLHDVAGRAVGRGDRRLAEGLCYAESVAGSSLTRVEMTDEPPALALCERSKDAEMTVLGACGHSALPGMLLGSVPWHVAAHGSGRTVVVRGQWEAVSAGAGPVVAGVDGSPASQDALTLAFEEAALHLAPLEAVCALADAPGVFGETRQMEEEFDHEMTRQEAKHPDTNVTRRLEAGSPRSSLMAAALGAQLLVIGARGRRCFKDQVLGSVALATLHYSPCPVAIVKPA
jgi:nucleotide-binding universal stress UspA family protein